MFSSLPPRVIRYFALLFFLVLVAPRAEGNAPPPDDERILGPPTEQVVVRTSALPLKVSRQRGKPTRIKIPASLLKNLNFGQDQKRGVLPPVDSINRTLIAGVALAIAAACAFVVLGRRLRYHRTVATAAVLLIAACCLISGATADIPVPGQPFTPNGPADPFTPNGPADRDPGYRIVVEITKAGDTIELLLGNDVPWAK